MADEVDTLQKAKELPCVFNNWAYFIKDASKRSISSTRRRCASFETIKNRAGQRKLSCP